MAVGFYAVQPIALPHAPYPRATLALVERAIVEAWRILRDEPAGDFDVKTANEDRITRDLRVCLTDKVLAGKLVPGFTPAQFRVNREAKFESFDGRHLDKMPDIHVDIIRDEFVSLPSADGLFVECKPIDSKHAAGGHYCDKGVARFVNGDYAWAMAQSLMIGYASPGYTLPKKLSEAFSKRKAALKVVGPLVPSAHCRSNDYAQLPHTSIHRRGFTYPATQTEAPDIAIRHLWLNRQSDDA